MYPFLPAHRSREERCGSRIAKIADPLKISLQDSTLVCVCIAVNTRQAKQLDSVCDLTPMQNRILQQLLKGASEKLIAGAVSRSVHTVHSHVKAIYRRLGVASRGELLALFVAPQFRQDRRMRTLVAGGGQFTETGIGSNAATSTQTNEFVSSDADEDSAANAHQGLE